MLLALWLSALTLGGLQAREPASADAKTSPLRDAAITEHAVVREGGAWKPARFVCDLADEVVWAVPERSTSAFSVSRMSKRAPDQLERRSYGSAGEPECGMSQCEQEWLDSKTGKRLLIHDRHLQDPGSGDWTVAYRLGEGKGEDVRWRTCATARFLNLLCVTKRRTIAITRDAGGRALYKSRNFHAGGGDGIELSAPPASVVGSPGGQRFFFEAPGYSYAVDVSSGAGARVTVAKDGRPIQTEECLATVWAQLEP